MIRNYLKIAFRNLVKNKTFSIINIAGLALGLTCCLLITMYVIDELSFDRFHTHADRIYRIDNNIKFGGKEFKLASVSDPLAFTLVKDYPQVENAVRFRQSGSSMVRYGDKVFKEERTIFADSTLFDVFSFPLIAGNPKTALTQPNSVVITERVAKKYFGDGNAIGKTLRINNEKDVQVTGVLQNIPSNSHIQADFFFAVSSLPESRENMWLNSDFHTYILLAENADPIAFEKELGNVVERYVSPQAQQFLNMSISDLKASGNYFTYDLVPMTKIHLHSNQMDELSPNGSIQYVYLFSAIAFFVLLIACINFMNLSTARSMNRAREVGVRKVLGSLKSSLIGQFLTESLLMTLVAFSLAIGATWLLLPWFNQLANKEIVFASFNQWWVFPIMLAFVVLTGLLAGSYPAFFLSRFRPVNVLKGRLSSGGNNNWLRSALVVVQFSASVLLIVSTMVIYRQLNFIQNKQLGFNKEQVLIIDDAYALGNNLQAFKQEILRENGVQRATISSYLPVTSSRSNSPIYTTPVPEQSKAISAQQWSVDYDYIQTMGMKILAGRDFSKDFPSDSTAIIINESAAKLCGFENPIGEDIYRMILTKEGQNFRKFKIIGVVKDFHFESLRENITPVTFHLGKSEDLISLRLDGNDISNLVSRIESKWRSMAAGQPFNYTFMDEAFDQMYRSEQRIGNIFVSFAILAIFIACLGLFGLAAFMAEQRTKEIGIRKVLGASFSNIVTMLSKDFLKLVLVAVVISFPVAWWSMNKWLENYAYRTEVSWWIFAMAGAVAVAIALLTVSFQAIRSATANPVESLRSE